MSILTNPSGAFSTSLIYITLGTLIDIWSILTWFYYQPETPWGHFLVVGFIVTGFALLVIGLLLGPIGRAARHAELPPSEVTAAVTQAENTAAAHPPAVVPGNMAVQGGVPMAPGVAANPAVPMNAQVGQAGIPIQRR